MDWQTILTSYVYPALGTILAAAVAYGIKVLIAWLKKQEQLADTEVKKGLVRIAIGFAEELDHQAKKGGDKMNSESKETAAIQKAVELATNKGVKLEAKEATDLIRALLGEKR